MFLYFNREDLRKDEGGKGIRERLIVLRRSRVSRRESRELDGREG